MRRLAAHYYRRSPDLLSEIRTAFKIPDPAPRIRQEVAALGGVALVIIDTSAAYYPGTDENDNVQMGAHARALRGLAELPRGPTVLVLCHPTKKAGNDDLLPRGRGAFVAEMDGNLVCTKNEALTTLHWQGKFRGPDFEAIAFELCPVTAAALKDSKGRPIPTVIAEPLDIEAGARRDEDSVLITLAECDGITLARYRRAAGLAQFQG